MPRVVSDDKQYIKAFSIYVGIIFLLYTGLCPLGPQAYIGFGGDAAQVGYDTDADKLQVPAWLPLALVIGLTGGATHFRHLNHLEFFARRFTHWLIGIPNDIEKFAMRPQDRRIDGDRLAPSDLDFLLTLLKEMGAEHITSLEQQRQVFAANDVVRRRLRLCLLAHILATKDVPGAFATIVRHQYGGILRDVQNLIAEYRKHPETVQLLMRREAELDPADRQRRRAFTHDVEASLHQLHALIAVGISPVRGNPRELKRITQAILLHEGSVPDNSVLNRLLFGLALLFCGVLVTVLLAGGDALKATIWATGAFALHAAAALTAWRIGHYCVLLRPSRCCGAASRNALPAGPGGWNPASGGSPLQPR